MSMILIFVASLNVCQTTNHVLPINCISTRSSHNHYIISSQGSQPQNPLLNQSETNQQHVAKLDAFCMVWVSIKRPYCQMKFKIKALSK